MLLIIYTLLNFFRRPIEIIVIYSTIRSGTHRIMSRFRFFIIEVACGLQTDRVELVSNYKRCNL